MCQRCRTPQPLAAMPHLHQGAGASALRLADRSGQIPEPNLIVAAPAVLTDRAVEGAPLLVVEVLSSSGRNRDLFEKRRVYADGRAGEYWIVDPDVPSLTVLRLAGDGYDEVAVVAGENAYETTEPFAVRVVPADIVRPPAGG